MSDLPTLDEFLTWKFPFVSYIEHPDFFPLPSGFAFSQNTGINTKKEVLMRRTLILLIALFLGCIASTFIGCNKPETTHYPLTQPTIEASDNSLYIAKVRLESVAIRLLVLKHCPDNIADIDADEAVQAANMAETKGLTINTIGNYHVNKEGKTNSMAWGKKISLDDLQGLKNFISEQMKVDAEPGDTIIVYTLGHGGDSGSIMRLGQRKDVMEAIAQAAEENDQETFWWQLSCHAAAKLPPISSLNERQQELFAMSASSPANELSYFRTQGKIFASVFNALANKSPQIDPNGDELITAGELGSFIGRGFGQERGDLVFAKSPDEPVFGYNGLANQIPIRDHNNPQTEYPRDYIPMPRGHAKR